MLYVAYAPQYHHALPEGHRFPMEKYSLLPEQLLYEGTLKADNFFAPVPITEADILLTHEADYWHSLHTLQLTRAEVRATGFPLSEALVRREILIAGGTLQCARYALHHGISANIAGGTHHAFTHRGEGFCLLNDQAMAAQVLLNEGLAQRVLIVDLDVHQGNGTAQIFAQEPRVFTFSMHGAHNYPLRKERSDLDVGLADGTDDDTYLGLLRQHLPRVIENFMPDFVFYQAGVDVLSTDKLGRLGVSREGCRLRDLEVLSLCHQYRLPVVVCMGGGYSTRLVDIVEAHANTFRVMQELWF